ncbi:MAG: hypothetical protein QXI39_00170 [Candidatus Bathyarchaeia archaeon]
MSKMDLLLVQLSCKAKSFRGRGSNAVQSISRLPERPPRFTVL